MQIESLYIIPENEKLREQPGSDKFSIGAKFNVSSYHAPGYYNSPHPYEVTIHFN